MPPDVRAVVQYDVGSAHFRYHGSEKFRIILRPNSYLVGGPDAIGAVGIDVDAEDCCVISEILPPHFQRSTFEDADFEHLDRRIEKLLKVSFIDFQIMRPLVNISAVMPEEEFRKIASRLIGKDLFFFWSDLPLQTDRRREIAPAC